MTHLPIAIWSFCFGSLAPTFRETCPPCQIFKGIGGGATGICVAHWLQKRVKTTDFAILERSNAVGGTWWERFSSATTDPLIPDSPATLRCRWANRYPGAGVDVNVYLYSLSFAPNTQWSETFAKQQENLDYLQRVAVDYNVEPFVQFNTEATQLIWNEGEKCWDVTVKYLPTGVERKVKADFVVNGTGFFSLPQMPKVEGIELFKGKQCHSAMWDQSMVLEGKKAVLVGNGASGLQIVENITDKVSKLDIFQSNPSWITPRNSEKLSELTKWMLRYVPGYAKYMRTKVYLQLDTAGWASAERSATMDC